MVAVVAVVALPDSAPEKVVVVRVLVPGLNVKPVPRLTALLPFAEVFTNRG